MHRLIKMLMGTVQPPLRDPAPACVSRLCEMLHKAARRQVPLQLVHSLPCIYIVLLSCALPWHDPLGPAASMSYGASGPADRLGHCVASAGTPCAASPSHHVHRSGRAHCKPGGTITRGNSCGEPLPKPNHSGHGQDAHMAWLSELCRTACTCIYCCARIRKVTMSWAASQALGGVVTEVCTLMQVRAMPNAPCVIRQAATAFVLGTHAVEKDAQKVIMLMSSVGALHLITVRASRVLLQPSACRTPPRPTAHS